MPTFADRQIDLHASALWVVAGRSTPTSELFVGALHEHGIGAHVVEPARLSDLMRRDDVVLDRLDDRRTLDGVENGIWSYAGFERAGRVLNPAPSLIARHDELQTALRLGRLRIPQRRTGFDVRIVVAAVVGAIERQSRPRALVVVVPPDGSATSTKPKISPSLLVAL
jgi:hypothetical protein